VTADTHVMAAPHVEEEGHHGGGINTALLGMLLFIGSETMFFAGLFGAYFNARAAALSQGQSWPPPGLENVIEPGIVPVLATIILISSSFTMQWGLWRIQKGDRTGMNRALAITLLMGIVFLGMQAFDYYELLVEEGFGINSGIYGTLFFTMTGFHGAHVAGGIVLLSVIWLRAFFTGAYTRHHHSPVELAGLYWHFVDLVWIILFTVVYLI
jgi:cytochrome c oxidase subunit 3